MKKSVVVLGAGPAGMIAALSAVKKGYPVTLITKYPYNTRGQRIKLDNDALNVLKEFNDPDDEKDKAFFLNLKRSGRTISISEIEEFLLRKINREKAAGNIDYYDERNGELSDIHINKEENIYEVEIKTKNNTKIKIPFVHLIRCRPRKVEDRGL